MGGVVGVVGLTESGRDSVALFEEIGAVVEAGVVRWGGLVLVVVGVWGGYGVECVCECV